MIKEFFESLKIKDIIFFVLIIVLFCMYFKKNKKEGFAGQISDANLQAIKNLGDFASNLQSGGTSGEYEFPGTTLDLNATNSKIKVSSIEADSIKIGTVTIDENYLNNILVKKSEVFLKSDNAVTKIGGSTLYFIEDAKQRCADKGRILASLDDLKKYEPSSPQGYGAWALDGNKYNGLNSGAPYADNSTRYDVDTPMWYENYNNAWCKLPWL